MHTAFGRMNVNKQGENMEKKISKISELRGYIKDVNIDAEVVDIGELREYNGSPVVTVTLDDGTGKCELGLWNEDIDKVRMNDKVLIRSALFEGKYYEGTPKITLGNFGELVVLDK